MQNSALNRETLLQKAKGEEQKSTETGAEIF